MPSPSTPPVQPDFHLLPSGASERAKSPTVLDLRLTNTITAPTSKKRTNENTTKPISKRHKAVRKLTFDDKKSSPVSGTFIRDSDSEDDIPKQSGLIRKTGDIDPSLNVVVVTEEARAELERIDNKIGDYICMLCHEKYLDAFGLAAHRCSRIVHVEYRCADCEKVFNCPANLASHRRWHKPRNGGTTSSTNTTNTVQS